MAAVLALDFGGTKLAAGVLDADSRRWLATGRCQAPSAEGARAVAARMLALADATWADAQAVASAQAAGSEQAPQAVGISFDGPVDMARGCPQTCHHVAGWEDYPLAEEVGAHYGLPVALDNDANAAALAEWRYGAGRGCDDLLYLTVSTGVGGGLVLGGRLYRGQQGLAGEIGHMGLDPDGPLCPCGRRGCLEALAAGPAIVRNLQEVLAASAASSALRGQGDLTARDVAQAAAAGDALAGEALRRAAQALGLGIGNALNLLNLERVILGGGVTSAGDFYLAWVRAAARARAVEGVAVDVRLAGLGDEAPLWGAAALAQTLLAD
jgi:glucokinase